MPFLIACPYSSALVALAPEVEVEEPELIYINQASFGK
jgi:hypothetical protein